MAKAQPADLRARLLARAKANARTQGPKCGVCSLPPEVQETIRELRAAKFSWPTISVSLKDEGIHATENMLLHHFRVHERQ